MADVPLQLHSVGTAPGRPRPLTARPAWPDLAPLRSVPRSAWVAAAVATIISLTATAHGGVSITAAIGVIACIPAALVDVVERRLPNRLVALAALAVGLSTAVESGVAGSPDLGSVAVGAGMMTVPLFVMHLASPSSMGFGDVKLAVVLGATVGAADGELALVALCLACAGTAAVGISTRRRHLPFGPGLVAGAALALALGPWVGGPS